MEPLKPPPMKMNFLRQDQVCACIYIHTYLHKHIHKQSYSYMLAMNERTNEYMNVVGAISTCYICAEMLKETKNKTVAAESLSATLGIPRGMKASRRSQDKGKYFK